MTKRLFPAIVLMSLAIAPLMAGCIYVTQPAEPAQPVQPAEPAQPAAPVLQAPQVVDTHCDSSQVWVDVYNPNGSEINIYVDTTFWDNEPDVGRQVATASAYEVVQPGATARIWQRPDGAARPPTLYCTSVANLLDTE